MLIFNITHQHTKNCEVSGNESLKKRRPLRIKVFKYLSIIRPCVYDNTTEINKGNWLEDRFRLRISFIEGNLEPFKACIHKLSIETIQAMIDKVGYTRFEVFSWIKNEKDEKRSTHQDVGFCAVIEYLENELEKKRNPSHPQIQQEKRIEPCPKISHFVVIDDGGNSWTATKYS